MYGSAAGLLFTVLISCMQPSGTGIGTYLACLLAGQMYGIGFAFGYRYVKSFAGTLLGVATTYSLLDMIFSRDRGSVTIFRIMMVSIVIMSCVGLAWIPGLVRGIGLLYRAHNYAKA